MALLKIKCWFCVRCRTMKYNKSNKVLLIFYVFSYFLQRCLPLEQTKKGEVFVPRQSRMHPLKWENRKAYEILIVLTFRLRYVSIDRILIEQEHESIRPKSAACFFVLKPAFLRLLGKINSEKNTAKSRISD